MVFWGLLSGVFIGFYAIFGEMHFLWMGGLFLFVLLLFVREIKFLLVALLLFVCGVLRVWVLDVDVQLFQEETYQSCVMREVDVRIDEVKYTVKVEGIDDLVLLNASRYPVYDYGDCFSFIGELVIPEVIDDFDYQKYLWRYGISYVVYRPIIFDVSDGEWSLYGCLLGVKSAFERRINELFLEPDASFLAGLLLGSRRGIDESLLEDFQRTGITHVIAISGYNITLLIVIVFAFFSVFERRIRIILSMLFVVVFVLLVGMGAAVVRAAIMGVVGLLALWSFRQQDTFLALMLAACLMVMVNPYILIVDLGFQMSFLATVGVIYLSPHIMKWVSFIPNKFAIRESFALTLAAQLMVLPVLVMNFDGISLVAPLVNIIVLPLIPWVMLFGFCAVSLSFLFFGMGKILAILPHVILSFVVFVVEFFSDFSFSYYYFT